MGSHSYLLGSRVGEASHPGPGKRKKQCLLSFKPWSAKERNICKKGTWHKRDLWRWLQCKKLTDVARTTISADDAREFIKWNRKTVFTDHMHVQRYA